MTRWSGFLAPLAALFALPAAAQPVAQAPLEPRWTISSPDCVSVNADGEPWDECGFQSYAMNEDGSRVLTVSATGIVQLWNGADGREIRRIAWPDQPGGASGYPSGRAMFVGGLAVALIHQNQLLVLDPADGRERVRTVVGFMMAWGAKPFGDRLFVEYRDRQWATHHGEIDLATGAVRAVPGLTDLNLVGPGYWVEGTRPPFIIHTIGRAATRTPLERACTPFDARFCISRAIPGRELHLFDVGLGRWRSFDLGQVYAGDTSVDLVLAGPHPYAVICGRSEGGSGRRSCALRDLEAGRELHRFAAQSAGAIGALDAEGRPEIRIGIVTDYAGGGETVRIAGDGTVSRIARRPVVGPLAPGGGALLPDWSAETALLVDPAGRTVVRFPFPPRSCGHVPAAGFTCHTASDDRRWLVPLSRRLREGSNDTRLELGLFELPAR